MPKSKKAPGEDYSENDYRLDLLQIKALTKNQKSLENEVKKIKDRVKNYARKVFGDDARDYSFEYNGKSITAKNGIQRRVSFTEDAIAILEEEASHIFSDIVETKTVVEIRKDLLEQAILNGEISENLLEKITKTVLVRTISVS